MTIIKYKKASKLCFREWLSWKKVANKTSVVNFVAGFNAGIEFLNNTVCKDYSGRIVEYEVPLKFEDIPDYGDLMTIEEFKDACSTHCFIDYDGHGELATKDKTSNIVIYPSQYKLNVPEWATHVMWFNK